MSLSLGIDIGGTQVKAVVLHPNGDELHRQTFDTRADLVEGWPLYIRSITRDIQKAIGQPARHIGLSAPGIAASDGRSIWWMMGRLEAVMGINWQQALEHDRPVPVLNDAQAALLGETWKGAAAGAQNAILLTLGTGVGGAILCDGRVLRGAIGRAGHLGHISLDPTGEKDIVNTPGSLELLIGNCTIEQRTQGRFKTTHALAAAHREGDREASAYWLKSVRDLACAIASIVNCVDPEVVIIGGGIAAAGEALFSPLNRFLDEVEWRPHAHRIRIVPASLGEYSGAIGSAKNAMG